MADRQLAAGATRRGAATGQLRFLRAVEAHPDTAALRADAHRCPPTATRSVKGAGEMQVVFAEACH